MISRFSSNTWKLTKVVLPQHTDHAGIMWNGAYLNWLEEGRIEALAHVGLRYRDLSAQGFEMPVVSLQINYISALSHGERVLLESKCLPRQLARWPWLTQFIRDGSVVAEAKVELVLVKKVGKGNRLVRNVPKDFSDALQKLQMGPAIGK